MNLSHLSIVATPFHLSISLGLVALCLGINKHRKLFKPDVQVQGYSLLLESFSPEDDVFLKAGRWPHFRGLTSGSREPSGHRTIKLIEKTITSHTHNAGIPGGLFPPERTHHRAGSGCLFPLSREASHTPQEIFSFFSPASQIDLSMAQ